LIKYIKLVKNIIIIIRSLASIVMIKILWLDKTYQISSFLFLSHEMQDHLLKTLIDTSFEVFKTVPYLVQAEEMLYVSLLIIHSMKNLII
jgi:hypothetical protein